MRTTIDPTHILNLLNNGLSANEIAEQYGYSPSGIRGMASKARAAEALQAEVNQRRQTPEPSPSEERVLSVIRHGRDAFSRFLHVNAEQVLTLLYTSDQHWPYQDDRAISLNIQISAHLQPDIIIDGSDFFDFDDYSQWEDSRTPAAKLWGSDIQRPLDLHADYHYEMVKHAKKSPYWLWLWGNHDMWLYEYLMSKNDGTSMYTFAQVLETLEAQGTLFEHWPERKHAVKLSPRLKVAHGVNASKNPGTTAKNTLEDFAGKAYEADNGQFYNVIYGHDHRSVVYDYYGVTAYGAGCNCLTDLPYLRAPAQWQQGVIVARFCPSTALVSAERINFYPHRNKLTCFVGGQQFFS